MLKQIYVTERVYDRLVRLAGPKQSVSNVVEQVLDFKQKYDADKTKLEAWINASEVKK